MLEEMEQLTKLPTSRLIELNGLIANELMFRQFPQTRDQFKKTFEELNSKR